VSQCATVYFSVCCSVLQYVVACCSERVKIAFARVNILHTVCCSVLWCVAVCCSVLQKARQHLACTLLQCAAVCVAVCCSVLQCATVCYSTLQCAAVCVVVRCSVLQRVAVCCSVSNESLGTLIEYVGVWDVLLFFLQKICASFGVCAK